MPSVFKSMRFYRLFRWVFITLFVCFLDIVMRFRGQLMRFRITAVLKHVLVCEVRWIRLTDYIDYSIITFCSLLACILSFFFVCFNYMYSCQCVRMSYWNKILLTYLLYLLNIMRNITVTHMHGYCRASGTGPIKRIALRPRGHAPVCRFAACVVNNLFIRFVQCTKAPATVQTCKQ